MSTNIKKPPAGWQLYEPPSPYTRAIGEMWEFWDEANHILRRGFFAAVPHMNAQGFVHGGMLMTFADSVMARNSYLMTSRRGVTMQMNASFLSPVREGQWVEATSNVERASESTVFLKVLVKADDQPCFSGTGIFRLRRIQSKPAH